MKQNRIAALLGLAVIAPLLGSCSTMAACLGISDCVPVYAPPGAGQPQADLLFTLDTRLSPQVVVQQLHIADNEQMSGAHFIGDLRFVVDRGETVVDRREMATKIPADQRVYLRSISKGNDGPKYSYTACVNVSSFIPQAQSTYEIIQVFQPDGCGVQITDHATGRMPVTFETHDANKALPLFL